MRHNSSTSNAKTTIQIVIWGRGASITVQHISYFRCILPAAKVYFHGKLILIHSELAAGKAARVKVYTKKHV